MGLKNTTHQIKILPTYASEHLRGYKPWELRRNDRNYKVGDVIKFIVVNKNNEPTGMTYKRTIKFLFLGGVYGLQDGFCIMTLTEEIIKKAKKDLYFIYKRKLKKGSELNFYETKVSERTDLIYLGSALIVFPVKYPIICCNGKLIEKEDYTLL